MELTSLGYVGLRSSKIEQWRGLATRILGLQEVDKGGGTRLFRMDDQTQRVILTESTHDELGFIGWEVAHAADLESLATRLDSRNINVEWGDRALCGERHVERLIVFTDPGGNRLEAFWRPAMADEPFVPGRPLSGFRTGPLGMGHVVLHVDDVDSLLPFYRDVLGFRITDYGLSPYKLYFFHLNGRHHSLAMVGSGRKGFHHFMLELCSLDDVGQAYDLAQQESGLVAYTMGRHLNDQVMSFYVNTPSDFFVEYGWGGLVIDPATWQPQETVAGPSSWGHDRLYTIAPEQRARLLAMRLRAAEEGIRAPNPVLTR
ncbi:VOC family protein [Paraburkholderia sp. 32]|uniref:VOC family protein n=1 Tax=unclassified Paraburkholderia TaxID=2615204 RepID=UPI003D1FD74A